MAMDLHFKIQRPDGRNENAAFPDDLSVRQLINEFVTDEKMHIQPADPDQWHLINENTGEPLDPQKSLHQNGVEEGHLLKLAPRKKNTPPVVSSVGKDQHVLNRCDNGHYYDPKKHSKCPYCPVGVIDFGARSLKIGSSSEGHTVPAGYQGTGSHPGISDDAPTRGIKLDAAGIDPVVGWLVAIGGPERGKDYRIRSENNTVGRSKDMYICISGDDSISRERHVVITFDPQRNAFHLSPGDGRGLAYLNGEALLAHKQLAPYDEILLGKTKLLFVPFCGDKFKWV